MQAGNMKAFQLIVLIVVILLTSGCTNEDKNVAISPAVTVTQTLILPLSIVPTLTENPLHNNTDDRNFIDSVEICYHNTPVINSTKTNLEFTICMQHTPLPTGACAQQFRSEILEYTTKDDSTTAGFNRETYNMQVARVRYSECLGRNHYINV